MAANAAGLLSGYGAPDLRGRGSQTLSEPPFPTEVVMAAKAAGLLSA